MITYLIMIFIMLFCFGKRTTQPTIAQLLNKRDKKAREYYDNLKTPQMTRGMKITKGELIMEVDGFDPSMLYARRRKPSVRSKSAGKEGFSMSPTLFTKIKNYIKNPFKRSHYKKINEKIQSAKIIKKITSADMKPIAISITATLGTLVIFNFLGITMVFPIVFGVTNTWNNGSADGKWSTDANWSATHKPAAGEDIIFDATSTAACSIDEDTASLATFSVNAGYTGVITNAASCDVTTTSDITISSGTTTSRTDCVWTCGGDFLKNGGTLTNWVMVLVVGKNGASISFNSPTGLYGLTTNDNTTITTSAVTVYAGGYTNAAGKTLTITGILFTQYELGVTKFNNPGIISGTGTLRFYSVNTDRILGTIGTVNCAVQMKNDINAVKSISFTLSANTVFGSTLDIFSDHATYTVSLLAGTSNYQLQVAGTTTLGARGVMTQGTGTWTFSGGLTQSGTSSVFTQGDGGTVNCTTYTQTAGTLTKTTGTYADKFNITTGFSTTGATVTAYKICLSFAGITTYSSDNQKSWIGFDVTSGTCTWNSGVGTTTIAYNWNISLGAVLSIGSGKTLYALDRAGTTTTNAGTISGAGTFRLYIDGSSLATFSWTVGTTTCNVIIGGGTGQGGLNFIVKYVGNTSFGSAVTIQGDGVNTVTLTPNTTTDTMTITGLLTLAATGVVTQGTGLWTLNGGVTINGTSAVYNMSAGGAISCANLTLTTGTFVEAAAVITSSGNVDLSGGTLTNSTASIAMTGASKTLKFPAGNYTIANLTITGSITLASNVTVNTLYTSTGMTSFSISTYTFTTAGATCGAESMTTNGTWNCNGTSSFASLTINSLSALFVQGGNITANGTTTMTLGTLTGNVSYTWSCTGNFAHNGGTLTPDVLNLIFSPDGDTLTIINNDRIKSLTISNFCITEILGGATLIITSGTISVENFSALIISITTLSLTAGWTYSNPGTISGTGTLELNINDYAKIITFGTVNSPVSIKGENGLSVGATLSLSADTILGSTLSISSLDSTRFMSLTDSGNYTLSVAGLTTIGGRGQIIQGEDLFTFSSGLIINGTSAKFIQGWDISTTDITLTSGTFEETSALITASGNIDLSGGTLTNSTASIIMTGTSKTLKLNASNYTIVNLIISGSTSALSNLNVNHNLTVSSTLAMDVYLLVFIPSVGGVYSNTGTISGSNGFHIDFTTGISFNISFGGTIICPLVIENNDISADASLTITDVNVLPISLIIQSNTEKTMSVIYSITFYSPTTNITIGNHGVLTIQKNLYPTDMNNLTVSVGGRLITHENLICCYGNWDTYEGDFAYDGSSIYLYGTGTIKAKIFRNLQIGGDYTLLSDIYVFGWYTLNGDLDKNGFEIYFTSGTGIIKGIGLHKYKMIDDFESYSDSRYMIIEGGWSFVDEDGATTAIKSLSDGNLSGYEIFSIKTKADNDVFLYYTFVDSSGNTSSEYKIALQKEWNVQELTILSGTCDMTDVSSIRLSYYEDADTNIYIDDILVYTMKEENKYKTWMPINLVSYDYTRQNKTTKFNIPEGRESIMQHMGEYNARGSMEIATFNEEETNFLNNKSMHHTKLLFKQDNEMLPIYVMNYDKNLKRFMRNGIQSRIPITFEEIYDDKKA